MKYELIPPEERHKYRCCVCNETRSVKYLIPTYHPLEGEGFHNLAYCNRCALLIADLEERRKLNE